MLIRNRKTNGRRLKECEGMEQKINNCGMGELEERKQGTKRMRKWEEM